MCGRGHRQYHAVVLSTVRSKGPMAFELNKAEGHDQKVKARYSSYIISNSRQTKDVTNDKLG